MNKRFFLGLVLFALGMCGVVTLLTVNIPIDNLPQEILDKYTQEELRLLMLINPAILLLISVTIGTLLFDKVGFEVPSISRLVNFRVGGHTFLHQLKFGAVFGVISGVLIVIVGASFEPYLPQEFAKISNEIEISVWSRFLYGGITEELLMRYGFMTFVVWVLTKGLKRVDSFVCWIGIILSTLLFAVGHFPVAFNAVENPSFILLSYILIGNSVAGLFFGWLYWRKGLEAAFIAHIMAHVIMIAGEYFKSNIIYH